MKLSKVVYVFVAFAFSVNAARADEDFISGWHTSPNNTVLRLRYQSVPFVSLADDIVHGGKHSLRISREIKVMPTRVQQAFIASSFKGKRVQFSGYARRKFTDGFAHIALKIGVVDDDVTYHCGFLKLTDETDWERFNFVIDVPNDAGVFLIQIGSEGKGVVWFDDFEFAVVSGDVEITDQPRRDGRRGLTVSPTQIGNAPRALNFEK